ncbi:hypothetical protein BJ138DRAFT_968253, partial [Hygrophoropsis aurantiaca]
QDLICVANIQHNCIDSKCQDTQERPVLQERHLTTVTTSVLKHQPTNSYFLNLYSLHNYEHLAAVVPENLQAK